VSGDRQPRPGDLEYRESERWPDYGVYRDGRVRSFKPKAKKPLLTARLGTNRYPYVEPSVDGKPVRVAVHRMVGLLWVPGYADGLELRHLDGDIWNFHADNLAWGTHLENMRDRDRHGRTARGRRQGNAKLTEPQVLEIRQLAAQGYAYPAIAALYGVNARTVGSAARGDQWRHVGGPVARRAPIMKRETA
jgi:hypothetical protein